MALSTVPFAGAVDPQTRMVVDELQRFRVRLAAGGSANAKLTVTGLKDTDTLISVLNNNAGTITDQTANCTIDSQQAFGTVTVGTPTAGDSVVVQGTTYRLRTLATDTQTLGEVNIVIGSSPTANGVAAALSSAINAKEPMRATGSLVMATVASNVVTVTARVKGTAGNSYTLAETGSSFTISGATFTDGDANAAIKCTNATDQLVVFFFSKP